MKVVKSLDDITLPDEGTVEIPRPKGELRIPIRPIAMAQHQKMMRDHAAPAAPQKFDKTGKMTQDGKPGFYFDESDPVHQKLVADNADAMMKDMVLAGVALDIPGDTVDEKWGNLSAKLTAGDMNLIMEAVNALSNITLVDEVKNS